MIQTSLARAFVGHVRVVTSMGQDFGFEARSCPLHLSIKTQWNTSPVYDAVHCAPWGRRCGDHRQKDVEIYTRHRRDGAAQGVWGEDTRP